MKWIVCIWLVLLAGIAPAFADDPSGKLPPDLAALVDALFTRWEDELTLDDVMRIVSRQKELNFPPGDQSLYSNTGFTLLSVVVERISGQSLAAFSSRRIFEPLGMSHSQIQDDHHRMIRNRAV